MSDPRALDLTMSREDAEEYSRSIAQIGEGWWRQIAWAFRQQIPEALGMGRKEWAETYHGYLKLPLPERREAVIELSAEGMSNVAIADTLGVSEGTVRNDLNDGSQDYEPVAEEQPESAPEASSLNDGSQDYDPEPDPEPVADPEPAAKPHIANNAGDNEWYTPAEYVKAAVAVMGGIDLDPASSDTANEIIGADTYFTVDDDGLMQDWAGRVWMNPPYAQPLVDKFCSRLARSHKLGDVTEACVLVNNATETSWFHALASVGSAVCFPKGRVKFWHPSKEATPLQGQVVLYLGPNVEVFRKEFVRFGITAVL